MKIVYPSIFYACFCFLMIHASQFAQNNNIDRSNHSLLWEISGNGLSSPSYLFGTFHNNALELFDQPDSVFFALNLAGAVSLEVDISKVMGDIDVIRNPYGQLPGSLKWLVQNPENITYTQYGSDAGRPQFLDMYFNQVADQCDKMFYPLETIQEQMAITLNFGRKKTGYTPKNNYTLEDMKRLYLEGDIEKLHDVTMESCLPLEGLYEDLIVKRNYIMAAGIDTLIHQYKLFCAVGAAHLGGPEGIIPILEEKGYTLRRVLPVFSENRQVFMDEIKSCAGFMFQDRIYGFEISLDGKPRQVIEKDGSHNLVYQELGQGNTFSIYSYHMEAPQSLSEVWQNIQNNIDAKETRDFEEIRLYDGTPAYQVFVKESSGEAYWIRFFTRNNITHILHATGGTRFLLSKRAMLFFDRFRFISDESDASGDLTKHILSPTATMRIQMPESGHEFSDGDREVQYWRRKSFNPFTGESFFVYESIMLNDYLTYTNTNFGSHLVEEFHPDSISFYEEQELVFFSEKKFKAKLHGQSVFGKIRQFGNILHFAQYNGEDSIKAQKFLSSLDFLNFESPDRFLNVRKNDFETKTTVSGFKKMPDLNDVDFRKMKHYALNDVPRAITYEIIIKEFKPWSFISKDLDSVLYDQISWPDSNFIPSVYSYDFSSEGDVRIMNFKINYTSAKNIWKGRVSLSGKDIRLVTLTYPSIADSIYADLPFIESTVFIKNELPTINRIDFEAIQQQVDGGPQKRAQFKEFLMESDVNGGTAWLLLSSIDNLGAVRSDIDRSNSIRNILVQKIDSLIDENALFDIWKSNYLAENLEFSSHILYLFTQFESSRLREMTKELEAREIYPVSYEIGELLSSRPQLFEENWDFFERLFIENIALWSFFDGLDSLSAKPFYQSFIQSERFRQHCMLPNQMPWVVLRYFDLLMKSGADKKVLSDAIEKWVVKGAAQEGVSLAAREALQQKVRKKSVKRLEADVFFAMGYALGTSVFSSHLGLDFIAANSLLPSRKVLGLLSFYAYLDEVEEENHSLIYHFDVTLEIDEETRIYAIYESMENGITYFFGRQIMKDFAIPYLDNIGSNTVFFRYEEQSVNMEMIKEKLLRELE